MPESTTQKLFKNFISLVSVQIANYILPLIVLPYLIHVIGGEKFGTIAFAQAVVGYLIMLTNFGFNLYGPREISIHRGDKSAVNKVFWNIFYAKSMLCLISAIIMAILLLVVPKFQKELLVFIFSFGFVIVGIFLPMWFFQGIEKMAYIGIFNFLMKIVYTLSVFVFIREADDYIYVPLYYALSEIFVGIITFVYILKKFSIRFLMPNTKSIIKTLRDAYILFFSNVCIGIYARIPPVLLGFIAGDLYVGYYTVAERIFYGLIGIQSHLSTTFYPHISRMVAADNREQTMTFIKKTLIITMSIAIPLAVATYIFTPMLINLAFGKALKESIIVLRILSWLFIIVGLSNVFGIQTMLAFNMKKAFVIPIASAVFINLIIGFILIPIMQHIGAALSLLVSEIWVTVMMFVILKLKGFDIIPNTKFTNAFIGEMFTKVQTYVSR